MKTKFYVKLEPCNTLVNLPDVKDRRIVLEAADNGHAAHVFVVRNKRSLSVVNAYILEIDKDGNLKLFEILTD